MATYQELIDEAETIRTNEVPSSNTANLVGGHLKKTLQYYKSEKENTDEKIDQLSLKVDDGLNDLGRKTDEKLDELSLEIGEVEAKYELYKGFINGDNGYNQSSDVNKRTGYIEVPEGGEIKFLGNVNTSNKSSGYAFYDHNQNRVGGSRFDYNTSIEETGSKEYVMDIPENAAFFRTTIESRYEGEFYCRVNGKNSLDKRVNETRQKIETFDQNIENIEKEVKENRESIGNKKLGQTWTAGAINGDNGYYMTNDNYSKSSKMAVTPGSIIRFLGMIKKSNNSYGYAFYDKDENRIAGSRFAVDTAMQDDIRVELTVKTPDNAVFFRTTIDKGGTDDFYAYESKNESHECRIYSLEQSTSFKDGDIISLNGKVVLDTLYDSAGKPVRVNSALKERPLMLIHFSDIHNDRANLERIIRFGTEYPVDDILHTGDTVWSYISDGIQFWETTQGSEKILNCVGNHDVREIDGDSWKEDVTVRTEEVTYEFLFKNIDKWGVNYTEGKCYYYKDYPGHNGTVRLIVLDMMHVSNAQVSWLRSRLEDARLNGYHVIIAKHTFNGGERPVKCSFTNILAEGERHRYSTPKWTFSVETDYAPIVQEYIDAGMIFIGWIVGHVHYDMVAVNPLYQKQMVIAVSTANASNIESSYHKRVVGKKSQDLFNVISIEPYYKIIKIYRVGANRDIFLQKTDSMVIDYGKGEVIYSI